MLGVEVPEIHGLRFYYKKDEIGNKYKGFVAFDNSTKEWYEL